ncbi:MULTISPECIES: hypothetical protein [Halorussus]|uniref:hypothetical protein n=1 Tax=Halorussus TaxID=1070314 RepID=UPI00209EBB89|nr:hypothetical protein [Halorussus vallis]USZ74685.1 hypothetical protein NGM07_14725 [Halorussus vallis]
MTALSDAVEEELDRLEEDAEEIEDLYTEFFNRIETHSSGSSGSMVTIPGVFWDTPSDELEELQREALRNYEVWYNSATPLIAEYLPNRQDDFEEHYREFKERLQLDKKARSNIQKVLNAQNSDFDSQQSILRSIPSKVRIEEVRVRRQISEEVSQDELETARRLFDDEVRASGVVAGVALERYLLMKCKNASSEINYNYNDGISTLAQKLFEADEIDSTPEKHLQHLADIRADCAHANEEDPESEDVKRLLEDTDDYVRGRKI